MNPEQATAATRPEPACVVITAVAWISLAAAIESFHELDQSG
jgi:hypothetical protein